MCQAADGWASGEASGEALHSAVLDYTDAVIAGGELNEYRVTWEIDISASSPREAAQYARDAQLRRDTEAVVFSVRDGSVAIIDLLDDEESP
jgi:hypothetical protein